MDRATREYVQTQLKKVRTICDRIEVVLEGHPNSALVAALMITMQSEIHKAEFILYEVTT